MTTATITATSKHDWHCYLDTPDYVVDAVNSMTKAILELADTPIQALQCIFEILSYFENFGFRDSDCENVAADIVNAHFKTQVHRFDVDI